MKIRLIAFVAALLLLTSVAPAEAAGVYAETYPGVVIAYAVNDTVYTLRCQGQVAGRTYYGAVLYGWMDTYVPPGQHRFVQVSTNPHSDPFVGGWQNIVCVIV